MKQIFLAAFRTAAISPYKKKIFFFYLRGREPSVVNYNHRESSISVWSHVSNTLKIYRSDGLIQNEINAKKIISSIKTFILNLDFHFPILLTWDFTKLDCNFQKIVWKQTFMKKNIVRWYEYSFAFADCPFLSNWTRKIVKKCFFLHTISIIAVKWWNRFLFFIFLEM